MDPIQGHLEQWADTDDREALTAALDALTGEWRRIIRKFLRRPSPEEVEDLLQSALEELVIVKRPRGPRALAPGDVRSAEAWRRSVLRRWLVDQLKKKRRRDHAEFGLGEGWSPETEKEVWRDQQAARARDEEPEVSDRELAPEPPRPPEIEEFIDDRRRFVARLPALTVRRRVLVLLAMGGDPSAFAVELARSIGDDPSSVQARIDEALISHRDEHGWLSTAMVRVVYPPPRPLSNAREAARRTLSRALEELRGEDP